MLSNMGNLRMRYLLRGVGNDVLAAMASGAVLAVGGTTIAICSAATGSTDWISLVAAGCGAGIYFQSTFAVRETQKDMERKSSAGKLAVGHLISALLGDQEVQHQKETDIATFWRLIKAYRTKMDLALNEACFWNEIENFSLPYTKERQFFAKMDRELHRRLKALLNARQNIESGSLIIEDSDLFERIDELLLAHTARCAQGLATLEYEYQRNAQFGYYIENNEPYLDMNKESPIREILPSSELYPDSPNANRDTYYPQTRRRSSTPQKTPKRSPPATSQQMYPDSPGTSRDTYYPPARPRTSSSKSPKDSPRKSPKRSPRRSPNESREN